MTTFILTLVLFTSDHGVAFTSVTHEYNNQAACESAKKELRNNLRGPASVILLVCTLKG